MSKIGEIVIVQCLDNIANLLDKPWWDVLATLATPIIALMVGYVAYQQYEIEESRLKKEHTLIRVKYTKL